MNPDCDVLLVYLDLPWNAKNDDKTLLNYFTNDLNLDAINFLLSNLKQEEMMIKQKYIQHILQFC